MRRILATVIAVALLPLFALGQRPTTAPSLLVDIRAEFFQASVAQPMDREAPVEDVIMGTTIVGTSVTKAKADFKLIPSPHPAVMQLVINGQTTSQTVGYNGPVQIYTTSVIPFIAKKRLELDKDGLKADIWRGKVDLETSLQGITTCSRFDRIVRKIAYKKYDEGKDQAQAIARERAEDQLVEALDKEVGASLREFNKGWVKRMAELKKQGVPTEKMTLSTTATTLEMRSSVAEKPKSPPPAVPANAELVVRLNEAFGNHIGRTYQGKTIKGDDLEKDASGLFGPPPEKAKPKDDGTPWTITFAPKDPINVVFSGRELMAVLRIAEFTSGDAAYSGMNVTAKYRFVDTPEGIVAVRQGKLEIYPPGFISGVSKLSGREQAMRTILERRFGKIMTEQVKIKDIELKNDKGPSTRLTLTTADTKDGWLTVAWRRAPAKK